MLEGDTWRGTRDLGIMFPRLKDLVQFAEGEEANIGIRLADRKEDARLSLDLDTTLVFRDKPTRGIKLQTVVELPVGEPDDLDSKFDQANEISNAFFSALVPTRERRRFMNQPDQ
jgi:hypothetical protein